MRLCRGQRFEFDERYATIEFATTASVRLSVYEQKEVPVSSLVSELRGFSGMMTNPHVGWVDIHYPTDGARPVVVSMLLAPAHCTFEYVQDLYETLADLISIPRDTPYELGASPQVPGSLGITGGESRFPEFPSYHNRDSFDLPE